MRKTVYAFAAFLAVLGTTQANAQSGAEIGILTCKVTDVSNVVVYTKQSFACEFKPGVGNAEIYDGQIKKIGVDLSVKDDFTIVWAVLAPTDVAYAPKSLAGTYVGGSADVALGGGMGAKILVGGGGNSFTLQPLSVAGVVGGGASVGVERFELK